MTLYSSLSQKITHPSVESRDYYYDPIMKKNIMAKHVIEENIEKSKNMNKELISDIIPQKKRATIAKKTILTGHGVHHNQQATLEFHPVAFGTGIHFIYGGKRIKADYHNVTDTCLCPCIGHDKHFLSTIEHLSAALAMLDITDLDIDYKPFAGFNYMGEIPILDGSAREFIDILQNVGLTYSSSQQKPLLILNKDITLQNGDAYIKATPSYRPFYNMTIDFGDNAIGRQQAGYYLLEDDLVLEIASARTFCLREDIEKMKANNLAQGGSLKNAIVVDGMDIINPEGLRYPNEFARHKLLDLIGDLALCGVTIIADIDAFKSGHKMNNDFLHMLFADESNFTVINE